MRRSEAIAVLKAAEPEIRARGAGALYLFGSVARDEAGPGSDVDVFVDPDPVRSFGFAGFMDIDELLQDRLGVPVGTTTRAGLTAACGRRSRRAPSASFDGRPAPSLPSRRGGVWRLA